MILNLLAVLMLCTPYVRAQDDWVLVWSDEFDGDSIDPDKWEHEVTAWGGGNNEFQVYSPAPENSWVEDGYLKLKARLLEGIVNPKTGEKFGQDFLYTGVLDLNDLWGYCTVGDNYGCYREAPHIPPIASARLRSAARFDYRYGRVDMRARMPIGDWLWPAIWMLPTDWTYGGWPESGEIDIIETRGNRNYYCGDPVNRKYIDIRYMESTLHWGINDDNKAWMTHGEYTVEDYLNNFGDVFHDFRYDWTPEGMRWYVDGILILTIPNPQIDERPSDNCWTGFYNFGFPDGGPQDPWQPNSTCDHFMAPFDQRFHFLINIAVGGNYFPDGCTNWDGDPAMVKPWYSWQSQTDAMWDFYGARQFWGDSWNWEGPHNEMWVDYVRVYRPEDGFERTQTPAGCPTPPEPHNCPGDDITQ